MPPLLVTAGGCRQTEPCRGLVLQFEATTYADWPLGGPRSIMFCCEYLSRRGGGPLDHHESPGKDSVLQAIASSHAYKPRAGRNKMEDRGPEIVKEKTVEDERGLSQDAEKEEGQAANRWERRTEDAGQSAAQGEGSNGKRAGREGPGREGPGREGPGWEGPSRERHAAKAPAVDEEPEC